MIHLAEKHEGVRNRRKIGSTFVISNKKKAVSFTTKTQMEILNQTTISEKRRIQRNFIGLLKSYEQGRILFYPKGYLPIQNQ